MEFAPSHNVKAIKGMVMKHLPAELKKQTTFKTLKIMFQDKPLKESDKLVSLNCGMTPVIVTF